MTGLLTCRHRHWCVATSVFAVLALAAVTESAKIIYKGLPIDDILLGIDAMGNVDAGNTFEGLVSLNINVDTGKTRVKITGQVDNESGVKQKYENNPEMEAQLALDVYNKSLYRVSAKGKAKFSASGTEMIVL